MYALDMGYVSFKLAFGNYDVWEAHYGKDVSIAAQDSKPARKEIFPDYKAQRVYGKSEAIQIVSDLRKYIAEESTLPLCKIEGSEADDILACWSLFNLDEIVTQDKDYFQLPRLNHTLTHEFKVYEKQTVLDKCSNFTYPLAKQNFALYQMLMGCTADNVPRILGYGKEGREQVADLLKAIEHKSLESALIAMFEDKILLNAKLILFPYFIYMNRYEDWFSLWCEGEYYNPDNWTDYYKLINHNLKPNTTQAQMSLWDF